MGKFTSIEICAGAGGQALGLDRAGFAHVACVEFDADAVETLRANRPNWRIFHGDVRNWNYSGSEAIDLLAGGVPCPPFSVAGKGLGQDDERDLFPEVIRLAREIQPRAIMIENVKGLLSKRFADYRSAILEQLAELGYVGEWRLLHSADYGVAQLRPRSLLVAFREGVSELFEWPDAASTRTTVGQAIGSHMAENGWRGAQEWAAQADDVAPTLVGGSKKHGGPDLGPTRAKAQWLERLGVDAKGIANEAPEPDFVGNPRLTVEMAAAIQGFPRDWIFTGKKTARYRQVGNAFPPPVAEAVGLAIRKALETADAKRGLEASA